MAIKASIKKIFRKSWAARPLRFQRQNLITDAFLGRGFIPTYIYIYICIYYIYTIYIIYIILTLYNIYSIQVYIDGCIDNSLRSTHRGTTNIS